METKMMFLYDLERIKNVLENYKKKLQEEQIPSNIYTIDTIEDLISKIEK